MSHSVPALEDRQHHITIERTPERLPNSCRLQGSSLCRVLCPHKSYKSVPGSLGLTDQRTNGTKLPVALRQLPNCFLPYSRWAKNHKPNQTPLGGSGDCRLPLSPSFEVPCSCSGAPDCSRLLLLDIVSEGRQVHLGRRLSHSVTPPHSST